MAKQLTPDQMIAALRKWKVNFIEWPGWRTRGYGPGSITDARGVMWHHTGGTAQSDNYVNFLFVEGRSDVPPPLTNVATRMNGQLILGAAERANHAGSGSSATLSKVSTGNYDWDGSTISPGPDDSNGNDNYYGNEFMYTGAAPMTREAYVTGILWSAAWCDAHGWPAYHVLGHKEHTARKIDPGNTFMGQVRRDVDAALKAGPGNWPVQQEEDVLTPEQVQQLATASTYSKWLADQFAQGAQFEEDLDIIKAGVDGLRIQLTDNQTAANNNHTALLAKLDEVIGAISGREAELSAAGRYAHVIDTITDWKETRDTERHTAMLAKLDELHPPVVAPKA